MNVGPTFDDPESKTDKSKPPKRISWISKNPRVNPTDKKRDEDYVKTIIWSVPPKAVVGKIWQNKDGSYGYWGEFVTTKSPNGTRTPSDEEKKELQALLKAEVPAADAYHEKLKKTNGYYKSMIARPGASWSAGFRLAVAIDHNVTGTSGTFRVPREHADHRAV